MKQRDDAQTVAYLAGAASRDALVRELVEKMQGVLRWFPTDQDMNELGWTARDINEACNAYDAGQAALSKASDEMKEDPQ